MGWGASGRNNGQVIPTMTAAEPDAIAKRYGTSGERFAKLIGNSADILFCIVREENIEAEAEQTGWFQSAHSPGRVQLSKARVEAWKRFGFPAEYLDSAATAKLLGSDFWYGGMFNPTGGHINPLALARGLAAAAERHGAVIHEQSPVTSYERKGDHWEVRTDNATVRAKVFCLRPTPIRASCAKACATSGAHYRTCSLMADGDNAGQRQPPRDDPSRSPAVSDTRGDLRFSVMTHAIV